MNIFAAIVIVCFLFAICVLLALWDVAKDDLKVEKREKEYYYKLYNEEVKQTKHLYDLVEEQQRELNKYKKSKRVRNSKKTRRG